LGTPRGQRRSIAAVKAANPADRSPEDSAMADDDKPETKSTTEFGRTMAGAAGRTAQDAGEFVQEASRDVGRAMKQAGQAVADQGEAAVEWVKARPVTSLAIGAAVGALIGFWIGRGTR